MVSSWIDRSNALWPSREITNSPTTPRLGSLSKDKCLCFAQRLDTFFSKRERYVTFALCHRPSVCRLSVVCLLSVVCNVGAPYSGG